MPRAQEVDEVSPGIFVWQAYDRKVKADLFSTALETHAGTYVVDPIPLGSDGLLSLWARRKAAGIFVTNANHARAAAVFAKTFLFTFMTNYAAALIFYRQPGCRMAKCFPRDLPQSRSTVGLWARPRCTTMITEAHWSLVTH